jgi:prepilin-type N-terminal cleavage/methylation domain-containing protein
MNTKAFTLIELLIVVAIIAILAAIAVPNFLEAQTRAKVTRVKADMRTVTTALEAYRVDNNSYMPGFPPGAGPAYNNPNENFYGWAQNFLMLETPTGHLAGGDLGNRLTTPVAYISSIPTDPFWVYYFHIIGIEVKKASFLYAASLIRPFDFSTSDPPKTYRSVTWYMRSIGPGHQFAGHAVYDPTNGTVSLGELIWVNTVGPLSR